MNIKNVDVLIGGSYGSEGKGNFISAIANRYTCMVRTGGPNAGHKVVRPDGVVVTFRHIPSGTAHNPTCDIVLAAGAVINPKVLLEEIQICGIDPARISIDPQAAVIYDEDIAWEKQNFALLGSTTNGVGKATINKIMRGTEDTGRPVMARDCPELAQFIRPALEVYARHGALPNRILLEGVQGTMLSLHHAGWPYVTSRDTSVSGQMGDAGIPPTRVDRVIMVIRTFPIRVKNPGQEDIGQTGGYSGPLENEISWEDVAASSGVPVEELKIRELTSCTKRLRRVAKFSDGDFLKALALNGPTDIAVSFMDYFKDADEGAAFVKHIEEIGQTPVTLLAHGFGADKVEKRGIWAGIETTPTNRNE